MVTESTLYFSGRDYRQGMGALWQGIFDMPLCSERKPRKMKLNKAYVLAVAFLPDAGRCRQQSKNTRRGTGVVGA